MKIFNKYKTLSENNRIVVSNVFGAFIVKGFALFVTLYTLPSYISFFNNNEVLGLWFTFLSLLNWILNFDLGIGNGLRNRLSTTIALSKNDDTKRYISSAYFSIGIIVVFISCIVPLVLHGIDLNKAFNIDKSILSPEAMYTSMVIVAVGVMLQFWFKLINSILYALQKSSLNNFLVLCTNLMILLYVKFAKSYDNDTNVIIMALVHGLAVIIPLLVATVWVFCNRLKFALPDLQYVKKQYIKDIIGLGGVFFFIQIAYMVIMSTNEYLITITSGNAYNIDYQAYYKLFSFGGTIFALMLTPLWSVVSKAKAENNILWIKKTYYRFLKLSFLFCLGEFVLIFFSESLMKIWLGNDCQVAISLNNSIYFALFGSLMIIVSVLSSIACGMGRLKSQAICYGIGAITKIPLAILIVDIMDSWVGVLIANIICMGIYCVVEPFVLEKYLNKKLDYTKIIQ